MLREINNLREIHAQCLCGGELNPDLSVWLGEALGEFLAHRCRSLDEALGLRFPKGGVPWWMEEAIRKRDSALRELARRFYAGASTSEKAREIATLSNRYGASAWIHDRKNETMPQCYAGTAKQFLWAAFNSGAAMPIGERQLRSILAD